MTIKEVKCDYCGKIIYKDIRRINESQKNGWKIYCCEECRKQARSKKVKVICANCGKEFEMQECKFSDSKSGNHFCSKSCSASFNNKLRQKSKEEKLKISQKLKKFYQTNSRKLTKVDTENGRKYECICKTCGKIFYSTKRNATHCSKECIKNDPEYIEKLRNKALERVKNGTHKGWISRNITSYPEQFWIDVLNKNNISFIREDHSNGTYFLDFLIKKNNKQIDLEIDGKQHKFKDRVESDKIRDKFLTNLGYIIYRIEWNSINNQSGSDLMKEKINKFIEFYNSI